MWKVSKNPKVEELTRTHRKRSVNLTVLVAVRDSEGKKRCAWCCEGLLRHPSQKYCCEDCSNSAMAWAYPQKEQSLFFLLHRQEWKCAECQYDWKKFVEQNIVGKFYGTRTNVDLETFNWWVVKRLKAIIDIKLRPEVDHTIPISKGGVCLGLEGKSCLCYTCHKAKTKIDNSGKRKR